MKISNEAIQDGYLKKKKSGWSPSPIKIKIAKGAHNIIYYINNDNLKLIFI
jgi:hypothetical protein